MLRAQIAAALGLAALSLTYPVQAKDIELPGSMVWVSYDVGATAYNSAVSIAATLKNETGTEVRILPAKSDVARLTPLKDGRAQFATLGTDSIFSQEGVYEFGAPNLGPVPVRYLALSISEGSTGLIVAADVNVESAADLKGKRMAIVKGSPVSRRLNLSYLAFGGLDFEDVEVVEVASLKAGIDAVIDGRADTAISNTNNSDGVRVSSSGRGLSWLVTPHDDSEAWERMWKVSPWLIKHVATIGPDVPESGLEMATLAYPIFSATEQTDEDLVYNLTKALFTYYDDFKDDYPSNAGFKLDSQRFSNVFVPIHAGAVRYYKEIGFWTSEFEARQQLNIERQALLAQAWNEAKEKTGDSADSDFSKAWQKIRADKLKAAGHDTVFEEW
jgi:TRAP transporter TAXI family solute receptor